VTGQAATAALSGRNCRAPEKKNEENAKFGKPSSGYTLQFSKLKGLHYSASTFTRTAFKNPCFVPLPACGII